MEVDEVLGTKEQVSGEDLEKLQYTEQVNNTVYSSSIVIGHNYSYN